MLLKKGIKIIILLGAIMTFLAGCYVIYSKAFPSKFIDELKIYIQISPLLLCPFIFLYLLKPINNSGEITHFFGSLIIGFTGIGLYLAFLNTGPGWGFEFVIVPVFQLLEFIVIWIIIALTNRLTADAPKPRR